jgi:hypothetical protein
VKFFGVQSFGVQSFGVQIRCSVLFDVQYLSTLGHSTFGHSMLGPYSALGPIRCSVIRRPVFRRSVIRRSVIRCPVFRRSVGESRKQGAMCPSPSRVNRHTTHTYRRWLFRSSNLIIWIIAHIFKVHQQNVKVINAESTKRRTAKRRKTKRRMVQNVEWKKR